MFVKMKSCSMSMSIVIFFLGSLAVNSFGQLVVNPQRPLREGKSYTLTCMSEDHRAALVWNDDLRNPSQHEDTAPIRRQFIPECAFTELDKCIANWKKTDDWTVVNSATHPMRPVFDSRWEEFREYSLQQNIYHYVSQVSQTGAVVFSARGLADINVWLCEDDPLRTLPKYSCFQITIPGGQNQTSTIQSCYYNSTTQREPSDTLCDKKEARHNELAIDANEWRTFILKWEKDHKEIQYYRDNEYLLKKEFLTWKNIKYLYVQSSDAGRIRFHFYDYHLVVKNNTKLSSAEFHVRQNLCVELLVDLCETCQLTVRIVDKYGDNYKNESISGDEKNTSGKLPTWRVVKLDVILEKFLDLTFTLEIDTILRQSRTPGWWAIDTFRECLSVDTVKMSTKTFHGSGTLTPLHLSPIIGCQRLSYSQNLMHTSNVSVTQRMSNSLQKDDRGRGGPSCIFHCTNLERYAGTSICDQSNSFCTPELEDSNCDILYSDDHYECNCQTICGFCKFGICDIRTGYCTLNCEDYYLPPYCKTKLTAPIVINVTAITAVLQYPKLDLKEAKVIHFLIKKKGSSKQNTLDITLYNSRKVMYEKLAEHLRPSSIYSVQAAVETTQGFVVMSTQASFNTTCQVPSKLRSLSPILLGNGVVRLTWQHLAKPYKWNKTFRISFEVLNTSLLINHGKTLEALITSHPRVQWNLFNHRCRIEYLSASTLYRIGIQATNLCGDSEMAYVDYRVPASPGFASEEKLEVNRIGTCIKLKLPSVINDTWQTVITVVVKGSLTRGSSPVPDYMRYIINMTEFDEGCIAATFKAPERPTGYITIGVERQNGSLENCHLHPSETYVILVVVIDSVDNASAVIASSPMYPTAEKPKELNVTWLAIPLTLLICFSLLFIWRRKLLIALNRGRQQNMVSQILTNFFKSTSTCTSQELPPLPRLAETELPGIISTHGTVAWNRYSHPIDIEDFEDYVKESIANGLLKSQFLMLPKGVNSPCKYGSLPENMPKNRYVNIIAYDNSRVILKKVPGDPYSDYINANYVQGFHKRKAYIATQGPKPQTVVDFWRMIWQEEAMIICMLANVVEDYKIKCEQYWPGFGESKTYGDIVIVTEKHEVFADYTFRTFRVSCKAESRKIEHLHFTGWPDHTVPQYSNSVIAYLKKLQTMSIGMRPIVVHCSAGVGRTGTIILCDICLRHAATRGTVDVLAELKKLRDSRLNLVDNELQYLFVHLVLAEYLLSPTTELPCNNDLPQAIEEQKKKLPQHMERLRETAWQDQALHPQISVRPPLPEHLAKNRFPELAPVSSGLVYLERYPTSDNNSDYISAVIVDGARMKKQYLASQLPLPSTLPDFWRLIAEQKIELVVILQQPDSNDPTCCDIIPDEKPLNPVPFINVELKISKDPEKSPNIHELLLTDTSRITARTQQVTILTCPEWGLGKSGKPPPPKKLVELWISSENIEREKGPTLVLCHNGITGCGLYVALSFLLERMSMERKYDIIFAARAIRRCRAEFLQSQEQFEYLCDAAVKYLETLDTCAEIA